MNHQTGGLSRRKLHIKKRTRLHAKKGNYEYSEVCVFLKGPDKKIRCLRRKMDIRTGKVTLITQKEFYSAYNSKLSKKYTAKTRPASRKRSRTRKRSRSRSRRKR